MSQITTAHTLVAVGTRNPKIHLVDLRTGSATHTLKGHKQAVLTVKWSTRDEFLLASGR